MMQKRIIRALFVILLGACILGSIYCDSTRNAKDNNKENIETESKETKADAVLDTEIESTEIEPLDIVAIEKSLDEIKHYEKKNFTFNYPIDDTFWGWLIDNYGEIAFNKLKAASKMKNISAEKWYEITGKSLHVLWAEFCHDYRQYTYMIENVNWLEKEADTSANGDIVIDIVGDINFDENWYSMKKARKLKNGIEGCFSDSIKKELTSADITVVNNEFTYGNGGNPIEGKDYVFQAKEDTVKYLSILGTDVVTLANNHVFDYGEEGLTNTIKVLKNAGIETVGAGENIDEASATKFFIVKGRMIGIISATEIERYGVKYTREAEKDLSGVFKMKDTTMLLEEAKRARSLCDYLIVVPHWGNEGDIYYVREQFDNAQALADCGVDAIIGGHPHRLQGCTFANSVPVAFSLGNFWFSTGDLFATIAQIKIDAEGQLSLRMIPCVQSELITSTIEDASVQKRFFEYLADTSYKVGIDQEGMLYDLSDEETAPKEAKIVYRSENKYKSHSSKNDLNGNRIDRVGNLE